MAQYIDRAAATSVCSSNRAYSTLQDISNLPCAKVVDRERFNRAANEIGESDECTDIDKMVLAVFVNRLEERLFGEVEHWQGYGRTITAPKGTFDKIFNDEEGEE